mgnify:CR=1 FL=1
MTAAWIASATPPSRAVAQARGPARQRRGVGGAGVVEQDRGAVGAVVGDGVGIAGLPLPRLEDGAVASEQAPALLRERVGPFGRGLGGGALGLGELDHVPQNDPQWDDTERNREPSTADRKAFPSSLASQWGPKRLLDHLSPSSHGGPGINVAVSAGRAQRLAASRYSRSNRSSRITFCHASAKSCTNCSSPSSAA